MDHNSFFTYIEPLMDRHNIQFRQYKLLGEYYIVLSEGRVEIYSSCRKNIDESYRSAIEFLDAYVLSLTATEWQDGSKAEDDVKKIIFAEIILSYPEFDKHPELKVKIEQLLTKIDAISPVRAIATILIQIESAASVENIRFNSDATFLYSKTKDIQFVSIRPCAEEYNKKTYLGVLIGDVATSVSGKISNKELIVSPSMMNPAIYIPETNSIVYGFASWWGKIKSPDQLREITTNDINNVWYVAALKELQKEQK